MADGKDRCHRYCDGGSRLIMVVVVEEVVVEEALGIGGMRRSEG